MARNFNSTPNRNASPDFDQSESEFAQDPLWGLLRQVPAQKPSVNFVEQTLRSVRLAKNTTPFLPLRWAITIGAAASVALALGLFFSAPLKVTPGYAENDLPTLDDMDEFVYEQAVNFAAENPAAFSDVELVSLILN